MGRLGGGWAWGGWAVAGRGGGGAGGAPVDALLLGLRAVEGGARLELAEVATVPVQCAGHLLV